MIVKEQDKLKLALPIVRFKLENCIFLFRLALFGCFIVESWVHNALEGLRNIPELGNFKQKGLLEHIVNDVSVKSGFFNAKL